MISCLVVEDNSFDRKVLRQAAEECCLDFDLCEAPDIRAAEDTLKDRVFDCIMLDFRLPDGDGLSFAKRFLAESETPTALIMMTAEGNEQLAREAFQLGMLDYLPKQDLGPESLERAVSSALAKIRLQRERQAALDELKRSNEALGRFAAIVAHDLRAPIQRMKTFSSFLGEDYRDALDDEGRKLLGRIERSADRAFSLIDGMLAYARLDKAGEERALVDVRSTVDGATANLAGLIEEAGALIEVDDLPRLVGVEPQLMQLFQNLINNALKFRHPDRALVIRIKADENQANALELSVEDNGIGVAPENQERVFGMLERLHSQDRYEGSGIGLAICRRIVENHGGRIWCRSEDGLGSRFVFTLDRQDAVAASAVRPPSTTWQQAVAS